MNTYHLASYLPDGTLRVYSRDSHPMNIAEQVADSLRIKHAPVSWLVVPASAPGQLRPFAAGKMGPAYA